MAAYEVQSGCYEKVWWISDLWPNTVFYLWRVKAKTFRVKSTAQQEKAFRCEQKWKLSPSSSSHSRSSEVPSSLVERVLVVKSQLHSVLGVTTFVSEGSPGNKDSIIARVQVTLTLVSRRCSTLWTDRHLYIIRADIIEAKWFTYWSSWKPPTGLLHSGGRRQNPPQRFVWNRPW